jgi:hypothetical protein
VSYGAESQPYGEVSLQITRADGTVVPIGVVERTRHRTPLHKAWFHLVTKPRTERRIRAANLDAARRAAPQED